jgi:urea transport system substrate-binding protein
MRRAAFWVLMLVIVLGVLATAWFGGPLLARTRPPIRVGILHSMTGSMAITESSMVDAEVLALEQLNARGGLLGRSLQWVIADGRSDPQVFAREARRLIEEEKVSVVFGCWTSACRKSVKPVVERAGNLLFYPVAYEGLELSPNIVYTGAAPNQQIIPTVSWCFNTLKSRSFFLLGTDSVWPRSVNTIVKDQFKALGASVVGEEYLGADADGLDDVIRKLTKAKPDVVLSTLEGTTNLTFYRKLRAAGVTSSKTPVVSFALSEEEFRAFPPGMLTGDYAVCNYFQAIDRPENLEFVRAFKARYGLDRVTGDAVATSYNSVLLWSQAVTDAESDEPRFVLGTIRRQSLDATEGIISIDRESKHTWRPFFVGKIRSDGQVDIVWKVEKQIRPLPYPFSRTREEWDAFIEQLYSGWGGNWEAPSTPTGTRRSPTPPAGTGAGTRS